MPTPPPQHIQIFIYRPRACPTCILLHLCRTCQPPMALPKYGSHSHLRPLSAHLVDFLSHTHRMDNCSPRPNLHPFQQLTHRTHSRLHCTMLLRPAFFPGPCVPLQRSTRSWRGGAGGGSSSGGTHSPRARSPDHHRTKPCGSRTSGQRRCGEGWGEFGAVE